VDIFKSKQLLNAVLRVPATHGAGEENLQGQNLIFQLQCYHLQQRAGNNTLLQDT